MQSGFLNSFPFDPLGLDSPEMAEKEIRNGRLAMLAFVGFASVYAVRGAGPIEALKEHIANPGYSNSALPSYSAPDVSPVPTPLSSIPVRTLHVLTLSLCHTQSSPARSAWSRPWQFAHLRWRLWSWRHARHSTRQMTSLMQSHGEACISDISEKCRPAMHVSLAGLKLEVAKAPRT